METFIVGQNVEKGEKLQWIVDGGKYKSSFLLPLEGDDPANNEGLLISETVVPGFEYNLPEIQYFLGVFVSWHAQGSHLTYAILASLLVHTALDEGRATLMRFQQCGSS